MAELKTITVHYKNITEKYTPAVDATATGGSTSRTVSGATIPVGTNDKYTFTDAGINAMSSTATPLVVRPGEDYKDFWKYIGQVVPVSGSTKYTNSQKCWNMAANDPRLFKAVVYTGMAGTNVGRTEWDNHCYGLMWDAAGTDVSYNTPSTGYVSMVGNGTATGGNGVYTKLGIVDGSLADASRLYDLQLRVNSLVEEIATLSDGGITTKLKELVGSATDANTLIEKINEYMNTNVADISGNYYLTDKRKEMNNVYSEINEQRTLRARKYRFVFYIVLAICIILGYVSYIQIANHRPDRRGKNLFSVGLVGELVDYHDCGSHIHSLFIWLGYEGKYIDGDTLCIRPRILDRAVMVGGCDILSINHHFLLRVL
jgi:hypothetical protein